MSKKNQVDSATLSHCLSSNNLIILGGTFDPIHNGHYSIIKSIKSVFPESKIIVVPTFQSPFKTKPLLVARQRLLLLKKLVLSIPNLTIDPYELYKEKTSYSIDTIKYIKDKNPTHKLYFCIGEDASQTLPKWKDFKSILELVTLLIVPRSSHTYSNSFTEQRYPTPSILLPMKTIDVSSTEIKLSIQALTPKKLRNWFPKNLIRPASILLNVNPIIGLTGQVGTGKTEATTFLSKTFKIDIIDLDLIGHSILEEKNVIASLVSHFGKKILDKKTKISRPHLGKIVFSDKLKLTSLNEIVHPLILEKVLSLISKRDNAVVIVGSLLEEIGILDYCATVVTISAKSSDVIKHIGEKKYSRRKFQQSDDILRKNSDHTIVNDYTHHFYLKLNELFESIIGLSPI